MKPTTKTRLAHNITMLAHEFRSVSPTEVAYEVEAAAQTLLAGAHFDDYIPVLAHRLAREHLRDRLVDAA